MQKKNVEIDLNRMDFGWSNSQIKYWKFLKRFGEKKYICFFCYFDLWIGFQLLFNWIWMSISNFS